MFLSKATDAHDLGSSPPGRDRQGKECSYADGQPGLEKSGLREAAARIKGFLGQVARSARPGPTVPYGLKACHDQPVKMCLPMCTGNNSSDHPNASIQRALSSIQVARLLGLWHRRAGRHGLPYDEHAFRWLRTGQPSWPSKRRHRATIKKPSPDGRSSSSILPRQRIVPAIKVFWYDGGQEGRRQNAGWQME